MSEVGLCGFVRKVDPTLDAAVKVKGGREEVCTLPNESRAGTLLRGDRGEGDRDSGGEHARSSSRTRTTHTGLDRAALNRWCRRLKRWADYSRLGDLSPHDLRRTAITRALETGLTYRQVQMMSKHRDPKTVMRYDHGRENLDQNAVNFLGYDEE